MDFSYLLNNPTSHITNKCPKGIEISYEQLSKVNIKREDFHCEWNYIIRSDIISE
ncbi:MAG: hypothetical protein EF812_05505 [Methanosarcinales archaeon]|nr:MAG: hypothetical protein EF812_05505 [Methanosarcinales archaeon]